MIVEKEVQKALFIHWVELIFDCRVYLTDNFLYPNDAI